MNIKALKAENAAVGNGCIKILSQIAQMGACGRKKATFFGAGGEGVGAFQMW